MAIPTDNFTNMTNMTNITDSDFILFNPAIGQYRLVYGLILMALIIPYCVKVVFIVLVSL